ncbi:MAG: multicopper oxidase domain-containing protein [Acidobacteria bacterium]|nr:multicopper oxidase domain-containing protein [Acidobacteriota bacterium]
MYLLLLNLLMGTPIDITQLPIQNEVYIVAIDVKVNPTNMPSAMLWDDPILLLYRQVSTFENIRADVVREELTQSYQSGMYQPVVLRTRQTESLTIHFMNLIGEGEAPVRIVQGPVCKSCPDAPETKAYTFSYGPQADQSQFPFLASIHTHGIKYTIDQDGTRAGNNMLNGPDHDGLVPPGQQRTYFYEQLDFAGVWPMHDHALPAHTVGRGLHMALVVEPVRPKVNPAHDFLLIYSDYPDYDQYIDDFYSGQFIPPFIHMQNSNVMHAHAINGYAAMLAPRMRMSVNMGATRFDAMRTDLIGDPKTPVFEVNLGDLVRFRFLSYGSSVTHSFHLHGHVWWDSETEKYSDLVNIPAGDSREILFYAGGPPYHLRSNMFLPDDKPVRSGPGDWLYHCHIIPHVKHGMWGVFRVLDQRPEMVQE